MTAPRLVLEVDQSLPEYKRLGEFAARLNTLLVNQKVQADKNLPAALDDFLGALYALVLARSLGFDDRPVGKQPERDKVRGRALEVSNGHIRVDGKWMAGFHFNSALLRLSAVYHRALRVITGDHAKGHMVDVLLPKLTYAWPHPNTKKVHTEVNKLKHDGGGLDAGRDAQFNQALESVDELLKLIELCPAYH